MSNGSAEIIPGILIEFLAGLIILFMPEHSLLGWGLMIVGIIVGLMGLAVAYMSN